jgi:hypothetical protein
VGSSRLGNTACNLGGAESGAYTSSFGIRVLGSCHSLFATFACLITVPRVKS